MALEGTIKEFGLADIFQLIGLQKKTGILFLKGGDSTVNISFEDGMVVKTEDSEKRQKYQIGRILINRGQITEGQLQEALEIQKSTLQNIGHIFVGQGYITKEQLNDALSFQMCEAIYKVFRWKGGDYKFYQDKVDYDRKAIKPISSEHILMEGIRMLDEWPYIEKKLPRSETVLQRTSGSSSAMLVEESADDIFSGFHSGEGSVPSREAMSILDMVDGVQSIYEITEHSSLGEFDVSKAIVELIEKKFVTRVDARPESLLLEEVAKPRRIIQLPGSIEALPYLFVAMAIIAIFLQVTGVRQVMMPRATRFEAIKDSFAVGQVEKLNDNLLLYFMDYGVYPAHVSSLKREDYLTNSEVIDSWGRYLTISQQKDGSVAAASAGPDGTAGTSDDIVGTF